MKQGWYHEMAFRPVRMKGFLFFCRMVWVVAGVACHNPYHTTESARLRAVWSLWL